MKAEWLKARSEIKRYRFRQNRAQLRMAANTDDDGSLLSAEEQGAEWMEYLGVY